MLNQEWKWLLSSFLKNHAWNLIIWNHVLSNFSKKYVKKKKNQNFIFEQLRICLIDVTALRQICWEDCCNSQNLAKDFSISCYEIKSVNFGMYLFTYIHICMTFSTWFINTEAVFDAKCNTQCRFTVPVFDLLCSFWGRVIWHS